MQIVTLFFSNKSVDPTVHNLDSSIPVFCCQLTLIGLCSTTGERDPVTSALLIILGRKVSLDIAQVVRWKSSPTAEVLPTVRYAASFAGYATACMRQYSFMVQITLHDFAFCWCIPENKELSCAYINSSVIIWWVWLLVLGQLLLKQAFICILHKSLP